MVCGVLCEVCDDVSLRAFELIAGTLLTFQITPQQISLSILHISLLTSHTLLLTSHTSVPTPYTSLISDLLGLVTCLSSDSSPTPQLSHFW